MTPCARVQRWIILASASMSVACSSVAAAAPMVLDAAMADVNGDGTADLAVLTLPDEKDYEVDFALYLRTPSDLKLERIETAQGRFWGTMSAGQRPNVRVLEGGKISIHTENTGVGRAHLEKTHVLSLRGAALVVSGFGYVAYDTIDHAGLGTCDMDLPNGKGLRDGKSFDAEPVRVKLAHWKDDIAMSVCGLGD